MYRGDITKDEFGSQAIFQELSASPTSIQAANMCLAYGLVAGHSTTLADAVKAYVQSLLKSKYPTWIALPKELHPRSWGNKFKKPVVLLVKSLYGHPESGSHWEEHLRKILIPMGGYEVPEHPSTFCFKSSRLLLTVYVDDLMVSGPTASHEPFWAELKKKVDLGEVTPVDRFLGRHHQFFELGKLRCVSYDMTDYAKQACDLYQSLPGSKPFRKAATPFCPEGSLLSEDDNSRGELAPNACRILMKTLWLARLSRPDLLKPIGDLASKVTCWSVNCDKMLFRLMSYLNETTNHQFYGFIGDPLSQLHLRVFADADFAGDRCESRSTSGGVIALCGPNSYFPVHWLSRKQTSTSRSTTESEVVSLATILFGEGLPMLSLAETFMDRKCLLELMEDNEATIKVIRKGYSAKLRHVRRTQKVDVGSLKECIDNDWVKLCYIRSAFQAADLFTKCLDAQKWSKALEMVNLHPSRSSLNVKDISQMLENFKVDNDRC